MTQTITQPFPFLLESLQFPDFAKRGRSPDQIAYCEALLGDLRAGKGPRFIQPRIELETLEEFERGDFFGKCPARNFTKWVSIEARDWYSIRHLPEEEQEQYGTPWLMSKRFRLYEIDIDNNPKNGRELVVYGAGAQSSHGQKAGDSQFSVVDLKTCRTKYSAQVSDVVHHPDSTVGLVMHRNVALVFETKHYPHESAHSLVFQRMVYVPKRKDLLFSHVCRFTAKDSTAPNRGVQPTPESGAADAGR